MNSHTVQWKQKKKSFVNKKYSFSGDKMVVMAVKQTHGTSFGGSYGHLVVKKRKKKLLCNQKEKT